MRILAEQVADLTVVPYIGAKAATDLIKLGCTSLELLKTKKAFQDHLSITQQIGLKFMGHLKEPVTRLESETIMVCVLHLFHMHD
jgi:hypothetical protein